MDVGAALSPGHLVRPGGGAYVLQGSRDEVRCGRKIKEESSVSRRLVNDVNVFLGGVSMIDRREISDISGCNVSGRGGGAGGGGLSLVQATSSWATLTGLLDGGGAASERGGGGGHRRRRWLSR